MILLGIIVFFVGAYSLLIFILSQHGKSSVLGRRYFIINNCEMNVCVIHLIPLYLFFFICRDIQFFCVRSINMYNKLWSYRGRSPCRINLFNIFNIMFIKTLCK